MTAATLTIADFLLARIAEDESVAAYAESRRDGNLSDHDTAGWWLGHYWHYTRHDPSRVLAECAAKRAIVEAADPEYGFGRLALRHLAAVYSDHEDYNPEWRP